MRPKNFISLVALTVTLAFQSTQAQTIEITPGELIVKYKENADQLQKAEIEEKYGLKKIKDVDSLKITLYQVEEKNVINVMYMLGKEGLIEYSEPNFIQKNKSVPNDAYYSTQWYLSNIGMPGAWDKYTGSTLTKVAVLDSGVNKLHSEISSKITSSGEWDYVDSDSDASDEGSSGHGSLIAGIIASQKNNAIGVAGIAENVAILPLRTGDSSALGNTNILDAALAVRRAVDNGCKIINYSSGGNTYSNTFYSAISYANDNNVLFVCPAGNEGVNNETIHSYPSDYNLPNIISVASSDISNNLSTFSNYGVSSVDIAAPGENIYNTGGGIYNLAYWGFDYGWDGWSQVNNSGYGFSWNSIYQGLFTSVDFWGYYASNSGLGLVSPVVNCSGYRKTKIYLSVSGSIGTGDVLGLYSLTPSNTFNNIGYLGAGLTDTSYAYDSSLRLDFSNNNRISIYFTSDYYYNSYFGIKDVQVTGIPGTVAEASSLYKNNSGTSFSAPVVAGVAAMLMSQDPSLTHLQVKSILMNTAKKTTSMNGKTVSGGIVDANAAMQYITSVKAVQTITFGAITTKTYGDGDFALNATTSSGLSVSYSSSDTSVAVINGNTVSIVGAGTATITASQGGNSTYSAAANVQQTLTVNKKSLVIVADNKTKEIGQSDPILTYTSFGLLSGSSITGALSRSAGESVGTYNINQGTITAGNNYAISFTQGSFVISAVAPQLAIITTTPPPSLVYDAANKPFGVSVTPPASVQGEYVNLASVGNPNSGYGITANLSPSGFRTTSYAEVDGVFRASQASTKISSTGLTYSFPSSLVSSTAGGEGARSQWQKTANSTGGPTSQMSSYFVPLGIDWSLNSLFAVPSCGITFDLSKLMSSSKTIEKFTFYYGMHSGNSTGDAAYAILLDGVLVSSGKNYTSANPFSNLIEVNIAPNNRFLTLVACDNGDDYNWDHSVFVDPKVYAKVGELSANCIYTGINGTIYGPSSVAPKDVGYYRLEVSSNDPNYIGTKTQEFTITPKSATVTAVAKTKVFGSADPTYTYTSSGLIGSDSLSGELTRAAGENVGSYDILVGTLSAGPNYTLSYTGASLGITAASLSSSAINIISPLSLVYDGTGKGHTANASGVSGFSYTYTGVSPTVYPSSATAPIDAGTYSVTVSSADANYSGSNTANFTITPMLVTITAADKTKVYGSADPTFTYTNSGLLGSDNLSGALTRAAGENVGSYDILLGTLSAGANYTLSYTGASLGITAASLSSSAINITGPSSLVYDGTGKGHTASAGGVSGFSYTYTGVSPTVYPSSAIAPKDVGIYTVTASSTDLNNSGSKVLEFLITPKSATVTAVAKTKVYGTADPALTYTSSGLVGSDSLSGALTRTDGENVGSYAIQIGTLSAGPNYTVSFTEDSMEITPKEVAVVASPKSKLYKSGDPALTFTSSSLLGSDSIRGDLTRVSGENVGFYEIRIGTLSAGDNYSLKYTAASLEITPQPLTVTAVAKTKAYGSADPSLTYTSSGLIGSDSLSGALTRAVGENVGSYNILVGTLSAGANYTLSYTGASLEITAASLGSSAINITPPSSLVYDGTGKGHTASASGVSGFSYTYTGVSPTEYPSSTTAPKDVGTYTVTASSTDINQSGSKTANFTITPRLMTITAADKTKAYGSADPTLTYTASGLIGSDTLSGALIRAEGENAGSYSILQGTLTVSSNYSLSYTEASLQITTAPVTVVAAAKTKTFGSADPALTYTASGLIGSDVLSGALTRAEGENVGSYSILQGTLTAGSNYSINYTEASLQITSATLSQDSITITAPFSLVYDGAGKSYTASASGVSGFSYTYTGVTPTSYASSSTAPTNVGTYKITASSTDLNYSGSKEVSFSITPAPVMVIAAAKTKTFGSADPALTYTASGLIGSDVLSGALTRAVGENAGSYNILHGTLAVGSNYSLSYTGALFTVNPAELASSAINITEPSSLVYNGLAKEFVAKINISGSTQSEIIQLSKIGNPNQGYGPVHDLPANGFKVTTFAGVDGVFLPQLGATKISSSGLAYSFSDNLVNRYGGADWRVSPWQDSNASTGVSLGNLYNYFSTMGINAAQNALFAAANSGITFDLSEIKPADKTFKKFTTYFGCHNSNTDGDVAYVILLDGVLVASGRNYTAWGPQYSGLIEVDILPTSRFLTLAACDNGDGRDSDAAVFVDPKLTAVVSAVNATVTYSGIDGTLYGPTSIPPSNAGNYKVTASSSDPNYSGSKEVNFVISPVSVAVVADDKTKKYGLADPELTFAATGLLGSDTLSGALARATGESPGTYAISIGTLSGTPNYSLSYTGASLVIQPNYESWAAAHNLAGNDASKDSDPDQDGLSNAHEFAMGGSPTIASKSTLVITSASGGMKCLWIQRKDKTLVSYSPKTSADLGAPFTDWTPVQSVLSNPQPEGIHSDYEQVEVIMPTNGGKGFLKVQATVR